MPREDATQGFQAPATIPKGRRSFTRLKRDRYIQALMKRLSVAAPWLQDIDMPLVKSFAQLERLSAEVYQRLRDEGLFAADGTPHVGLQKFIQLRKTQATIASMLGFAPTSRAAIKGDGGLPIDLANLELANARVERIMKQRNGTADEDEP